LAPGLEAATSCKHECFITKYAAFCGEKKRELMQHFSESSVNILVAKIYEILSVGGGIG